jgi:hypothetical protein
MAKVKLGGDGADRYAYFLCPGCDDVHCCRIVSGGGHPCWGFNGDLEKPTFTPSVKVTYPANPDADDDFAEWRTERICHSYVRSGRIEYLSDCTHALAGKTVDLPEVGDA